MEKTELFDGIKSQRSPRRVLVREPLVVTQELADSSWKISWLKILTQWEAVSTAICSRSTEQGAN